MPAKQTKEKKPLNKLPPTGSFDIDNSKPYAILGDKAQLEVFVPVTGPDRPDWLNRDLLLSGNGSMAGGDDDVSISGLLSEASSSHPSRRNSQEEAQRYEASAYLQDLPGSVPVEGLENEAFALPELGLTSGAYQLGDYLLEADDEDPENEGDLPGDMSIFIEWSDDSESEQEPPTKRPKTVDEPAVFKKPGSAYSQIDPANILSFRRNADPANAALTHGNHMLSAMSKLSIPPLVFDQPPKQGHKRKASDPPYSSPRYDGVTPVQRVIRPSKRRRTITS